MRQSSLRNQRSKGLKMKQVLQVCVLAAICFWLLYQLKHSYDKKRAIEEEMNATISDRVKLSQGGLFKLGRKDLLPNVEANGLAIETNVKENENEVGGEEEEEPETKHESANEESRGTVDEEFDETEERDQEKVDEDAEHGSTEEEDKNVLVDGAHSLVEEEHKGDSREAREENYNKDDASSAVRHDDGGRHVGGSREAREEHYTKDDASSAVRHEDETMETVFGREGARNNEENIEHKERDVDSTANGSKVNGDSDMGARSSKVANGNASTVPLGENGTILNDGLLKNGTSVEDRGHELQVPNSKVQSLSNSTSAGYDSPRELQTNLTASTGNNNQMVLQANTTADLLINPTEAQKNSTEVDAAISSAAPQNETVKLDPVQDRNATLDVEIAGEVKTNSADVAIELPEKSNTTVNGDAGQGGSDEDDSSSPIEKPNTTKNNVAAQGELNHLLQLEKSNASENGDAQGEIIDPLHKTVKAEEREAPMDLSTE